jgi:hypothetical protein
VLVRCDAREIQVLGNALSLPPLSSLSDRKTKMDEVAHLLKLLQSQRSVLLGSLLPVANQQMKVYRSVLSQARIQGAALRLDVDSEAFVGSNEAADWRKLLPFSPLMTGELLNM